MDAVFRYHIPELHPLAVHFPIALLLAAALAALIWMVWGAPFWRRVTCLLATAGAAGALFAWFTGDAMAEQAAGVPIVDELVDLHERMALYALIAALLASATLGLLTWAASASRRGRFADSAPDRLPYRLAAGLLALLAAALTAWAGHIGATMTWGVSG